MDNDQELAKRVDGIDIIVGGHSHTKLEQPVVVDKDENGAEKDPTVIVQAYQYNDFLGTLDVEFDENGVVTGQVGELIAIADKEEDPAVAEALKEYSSKIEKSKMNQQVQQQLLNCQTQELQILKEQKLVYETAKPLLEI